MSEPRHIIVTGANRGLGLGLVTKLVQRGDQVIATVRTLPLDPSSALVLLHALHPAQLTIYACDMGQPEQISAFAAAMQPHNIAGLINNAGVWGDHQSVDDLNFTEAAHLYQVNALAPLQLSLALRTPLRRGNGKIMHITSGLASIADNQSGGNYGYRMSKAALNMMSKSLAIDLKADGIVSAVVEPGWVQTDMGGPNAPTTIEDSVRGLIEQFDALNAGASGQFLSYRGGTMPW